MDENGLKEDQSAASPETVWVFGGGQFGRRGVELVRNGSPEATIIVVDKRPVHTFPDDVEIVCADGVEWLLEAFTADTTVGRIIPALPLHLAVEWLKKKLSVDGAVIQSLELPDKLLRLFPHPVRISPGCAALSHADFLCPPNCSEPGDICTYTGQQRPPSLYRFLETMDCGEFKQLIVRSRQFAPGVGGFYPEDLWNLLQQARLMADIPLLVGTACKCHGIVDTFVHTRSSGDLANR